MAFITIDDVKVYLVKESASFNPTDFDTTLLNNLIDSVCLFLEQQIGRSIEVRQFDEYYTVYRTNHVYLNNFPVVSVNTIEISSGFYNFISLNIDDFFVDKDKGLLIYKYGNLYTVENGFHIVYTAGFETIPSDLKHVACELVAILYHKIRMQTTDIRYYSEKGRNVSFQVGSILTPYHKAVIEKYEKMRI